MANISANCRRLPTAALQTAWGKFLLPGEQTAPVIARLVGVELKIRGQWDATC
jgi:hypothetical protein